MVKTTEQLNKEFGVAFDKNIYLGRRKLHSSAKKILDIFFNAVLVAVLIFAIIFVRPFLGSMLHYIANHLLPVLIIFVLSFFISVFWYMYREEEIDEDEITEISSMQNYMIEVGRSSFIK